MFSKRFYSWSYYFSSSGKSLHLERKTLLGLKEYFEHLLEVRVEMFKIPEEIINGTYSATCTRI